MKKILWFHKGNPSKEEREKAKEIGAVFRNPEFILPGDAVETFDEVMGDVPASYLVKPILEKSADTLPEPPAEVNKSRHSPVESAEEEVVILANLSIAELRDFAQKQGLSLPSNVKTKAALISNIYQQMGGAE